jgi:hypothetical protein
MGIVLTCPELIRDVVGRAAGHMRDLSRDGCSQLAAKSPRD